MRLSMGDGISFIVFLLFFGVFSALLAGRYCGQLQLEARGPVYMGTTTSDGQTEAWRPACIKFPRQVMRELW
jgi:hypothetical protein